MRSAALVTRSGLASTNRAPRGFCWSSNPRTISGTLEAAGEDLVTAALAVDALVMALVLLVLAVALDFLLLMTGLLKGRRAPVRGPVAGCKGSVSNRRRPTGWFLTRD